MTRLIMKLIELSSTCAYVILIAGVWAWYEKHP